MGSFPLTPHDGIGNMTDVRNTSHGIWFTRRLALWHNDTGKANCAEKMRFVWQCCWLGLTQMAMADSPPRAQSIPFRPSQETVTESKSPVFHELFQREPDIVTDLPQQDWRNIPAGMKRNSCTTAIMMSKLLVRATLTYRKETKPCQNGSNFLGFENWGIAHLKPPLQYVFL